MRQLGSALNLRLPRQPVRTIRQTAFRINRPMLRKGAKALILEVALLKIRAGQTEDFENAFCDAQSIISATPGYISHELQRCIEAPDKYLLLVKWRRFEDHTVGFRQSSQYQDWKRLLHHFYDPFPTVEHFEVVFEHRTTTPIDT